MIHGAKKLIFRHSRHRFFLHHAYGANETLYAIPGPHAPHRSPPPPRTRCTRRSCATDGSSAARAASATGAGSPTGRQTAGRRGGRPPRPGVWERLAGGLGSRPERTESIYSLADPPPPAGVSDWFFFSSRLTDWFLSQPPGGQTLFLRRKFTKFLKFLKFFLSFFRHFEISRSFQASKGGQRAIMASNQHRQKVQNPFFCVLSGWAMFQ